MGSQASVSVVVTVASVDMAVPDAPTSNELMKIFLRSVDEDRDERSVNKCFV